ncbi:MBL fold metallo-hydrolase [Sporolactobacillus sp. THM7-4]|nr:MBL fold metallo-hydrolase [Sporolactobacillus sp. THM7-4]
MKVIIYTNRNVSIFRSSLQETVTTVVMSRDVVLVVDPTWLPSEVEEIKTYVDRIIGQRKLYLLFTHSDFDHIIGYNAFPGAKVIASGAFAKSSLEKQNRILSEIKSFDDEFYLTRPYKTAFPKVDHTFKRDGETFKIGDLQLTFYNAPGHNDDGMFTIIEPLGILLSGDYFCDVEFPYIYYSGELYEKTLAKLDIIMKQIDIRLMIPGHGNYTTNKQEMKKRQSDSLNYLHFMRKLIKENDQEAIDHLIDRYKFLTIMKKFHKDNMMLLKKEMEQ